jgi:hypothetical protein
MLISDAGQAKHVVRCSRRLDLTTIGRKPHQC